MSGFRTENNSEFLESFSRSEEARECMQISLFNEPNSVNLWKEFPFLTRF